MLPRLENYDWEEVFKYATPHMCEAGHEHGPESVLFCKPVPVTAFTRDDVRRIISMVDGENDGPEWVGVFELNDGRFACIRAGCDYTGFD
jgi:hypothetical protein